MAIPELKAGPAALEKDYGPLGRRLYAEVNDAFDHLEALVSGPGAPIDADYARTGQLYLAHTPRVVPSLQALAREHHDELGEDVHFVPREQLREEIGSDAHAGGVVLERTGGLHPAKLHAGLARLTLEAGAQIHDLTRAREIERRERAGFRVTTSRGPIDTGTVLVLTNAYADSLVPWLRRRVVPIGSFIIATEVLDPELARSVSPRHRMFVDTKNFLFYWRLTPDGRVLFGGRRSLASSTVPQARDFLYDSMLDIHPQLAGVRVEFAWGGHVAITLDRLPHAGCHDGVWFATGCNGSGVALNTWLGRRLAETALGETPPPAISELATPGIPAHALRHLYLPLVGQWLRWQDRARRP